MRLALYAHPHCINSAQDVRGVNLEQRALNGARGSARLSLEVLSQELLQEGFGLSLGVGLSGLQELVPQGRAGT